MTDPLTPSQEWWTAEELASAGLPDMPASRQGVEAAIKRLRWREDPHHARRRAGKGGGWEYSWRLLPDRAKRKLLQAAAAVAEAPKAPATCLASWAATSTTTMGLTGRASGRQSPMRRYISLARRRGNSVRKQGAPRRARSVQRARTILSYCPGAISPPARFWASRMKTARMFSESSWKTLRRRCRAEPPACPPQALDRGP